MKIEEITEKLNQINLIVKDLDPSLKEKAVEILVAKAFAGRTEDGDVKPVSPRVVETNNDVAAFFSSHDHSRPKDNVHLIAAWLYSQHGSFAISRKHIDDLAASVGLIVPSRPDNTMRFATANGKNLYRQVGKGWEPTVTGEIYFKEKYGVSKGRTPLEVQE